MKVVIIGGGSAGTTCAFDLRKVNKEVEITILEKSNNPQYSQCGLPYLISKEVKKIENLFLFTKQDYENNKINLLLNTCVKSIDRKNKKVLTEDNKQFFYDKLVITTGGYCSIPEIKGIEDSGFKKLKTPEDVKNILRNLNKNKIYVIIGAGMVGVELSASLASRGKQVYLLESKENILPDMLDPEISKELKEYLNQAGILVFEKTDIIEIKNKKLKIKEKEISFDDIFLCAGLKPDKTIAEMAGIKNNKGIIVDEFLRTSDKNIFACGDCVESINFITNEKIPTQMGTIAVNQAKIVSKNILKSKLKFDKVLNNTISKIGQLYVGSVGITERKAKEFKIKTVSAKYMGNLRSEYYSSDEKIIIKIICNLNQEIIGGQIIGHNEVVGRLDLLAIAIQNKIKLKDFIKLETCYNPASSPIFDPLMIAVEICLKKLELIKN